MTDEDLDPPATYALADGTRRLWASGWYRARPQIFEHYELFFERDALYLVFAEESYRSFLLRRDGREREARRVGERSKRRPPDALLENERSERIDWNAVEDVDLRAGSLLFKPRLRVETADRLHEFYHVDRSYDVEAFARAIEGIGNGERSVVTSDPPLTL